MFLGLRKLAAYIQLELFRGYLFKIPALSVGFMRTSPSLKREDERVAIGSTKTQDTFLQQVMYLRHKKHIESSDDRCNYYKIVTVK
jgi:folylpolyglutamate synthase/dihydropteroate synthase